MKEIKKKYHRPELDVAEIDSDKVILTSGEDKPRDPDETEIL